MKRTKPPRRATAILTADLHLSENTPVSRIDDYLNAQKRKLDFLQNLSEKHDCPIICAGDVFDTWKTSPWFNAWVYQNLPKNMIVIPGNHDLPNHSMNQYDKSAMYLFEQILGDKFIVLKNNGVKFGNVYVYGIPYGMEFDLQNYENTSSEVNRKILILHTYIVPRNNRNTTWNVSLLSDNEIIENYENLFDVIVAGDNHESFIFQKGKTLLVNPGSMMRITADQADFQPRCFLYFSETNTIEEVMFPIEKNVINTEHLDRQKERDERISAYIKHLNTGWKHQLSFQDNLQMFFEKNKTEKKVRDLIWEHLEMNN